MYIPAPVTNSSMIYEPIRADTTVAIECCISHHVHPIGIIRDTSFNLIGWEQETEQNTPSPNMFFTKASLIFVVVTLAALFCAQPVDAARGPKISHKVYFDIKHGDKDLGRGAFVYPWYLLVR